MTFASTERFLRTRAGRAEFRAQTIALPRPARNLLMVIDESRTGTEWVGQVQGSSEADLRQLIAAGLITVATAAPRDHDGPVSVEAALQRWSYEALYTLLTAEARERFGLIRGYKLILQIEACATIQELRAVALAFVDNVRRTHGAEPAARLRRQLGAT